MSVFLTALKRVNNLDVRHLDGTKIDYDKTGESDLKKYIKLAREQRKENRRNKKGTYNVGF